MSTEETLYGTDRVIADIVRERKRQVVVEGHTRLHDDQHDASEIANAAAAYCVSAALGIETPAPKTTQNYSVLRALWPWDAASFKPKTPRDDLVRAAALIVAEIERIDRTADSHPDRTRLTALDDQLDHDAARVERAGRGGLHVHLDPRHRLTAVGDRVLIEPAVESGAAVRAELQGDAAEVAQQIPAGMSATCADSGPVSSPAVESSPPACAADSGSCGGGE